jgi:monothiol glutaredoxin
MQLATVQKDCMTDIATQIESTIKDNAIVLFMKGTKKIPQCGFSATVVQILERCGVDFKDVNVLADPELREGVKQFSNWPTIPQLYVKGEFIGGCDIAREMYQNGELQALLKDKGIPSQAA